MLKQILLGMISQNSYINYLTYKSLFYCETKNLEQIITKLKNDDYLVSTESIRNFRRDVSEKNKKFNTRDITWNNTHIYGIWKAIFGDYEKQNDYQTPAIEHGLVFHDEVYRDVLYTSRMSCCTFSKFRKDIIQKKVNIPVFCVGPYISYAKQFYPKEELLRLKAKYGKTLLVFPTHSTDSSEITVNQKKFLKNIQYVSKDYDTVLINTFWWNINDPLIRMLECEGYKIITCGFRDDTNFLSRLKSYLSIADLAMGDSIGTHVGYCVALNIPFCYIPSDTKVKLKLQEELKDISFVEKHQETISKCFLYSHEISNSQREICNFYWGNNELKANKDISEIMLINEDLYKSCCGNKFLLKTAIGKVLNKYANNNDSEKYNLLINAIKLKKNSKY